MSVNNNSQFNPDLLETLLAQQVDLNQVTPANGLKKYLKHREEELTPATLSVHKSRLKHFIEWCRENDIEYLNDLDGGDLQEFRNWRKEQLSVSSLASNLHTIRAFLQVGVKNETVRPDLPSKVDIPTVDASEESRDVMVPAETANDILNYLNDYHYATTQHACWLLLAATGMRTSAVRALDLEDYEHTDEGAKLDLVHRPDSDTGLKNKSRSERPVFIGPGIADVIDDYLAEHRPDVTDSYGRRPLLASHQGRLSSSTIRKYVYMWTRPCARNQACPHGYSDDEIGDCEWAIDAHKASHCPSSSSPHTVRRGYITHELGAKIPDDVVSARCDVSPSVIDAFYDERDGSEKLTLRKEIREAAYQDSDKDEYHK